MNTFPTAEQILAEIRAALPPELEGFTLVGCIEQLIQRAKTAEARCDGLLATFKEATKDRKHQFEVGQRGLMTRAEAAEVAVRHQVELISVQTSRIAALEAVNASWLKKSLAIDEAAARSSRS